MIKHSQDFYSVADAVTFMNKLTDPMSSTIVPDVSKLADGSVTTKFIVVYAEGCCDEK